MDKDLLVFNMNWSDKLDILDTVAGVSHLRALKPSVIDEVREHKNMGRRKECGVLRNFRRQSDISLSGVEIKLEGQCNMRKTTGKKSSLERLSRIVDSIVADEDEGGIEGSGSEPSAV
ncbi:hypothetical protein DINM_005061 [Dirofilaria immitis]|nr:hypothetical protein [Dirofilaria immitis]